MVHSIAGVLLAITLAAVAYELKLFDNYGSFLSGALGVSIAFIAGIKWLLVLVSFVLLGILATRFGHRNTGGKNFSFEMNGKRRSKNVLANGAIPLIVAFMIFAGLGAEKNLLAIYAGAIATATSDTLSSEIGMIDGSPRLLTAPWKKVKPGVDGGISLLGQMAALLGAVLIAILCTFLFNPYYFVPIAVGGFFGCQTDSLLGAILERKDILSNEGVNLLSTATGGVISFFLFI